MLSDYNIHLSKLLTCNKIQVGYVPLKLIYYLKKTSYANPAKEKAGNMLRNQINLNTVYI